MDKRLALLCGVIAVGMILLSVPDGALSLLLVLLISIPAIIVVRSNTKDEKQFITNIFIIALLARIILGFAIHIFDLRDIFGPDSALYDEVGQRLMSIWWDLPVPEDYFTFRARNPGTSGWGMYYLVGAIYYIFGSSILVAQTFCAVIGALTSPLVYFCAREIFNNKRVAKLSAIFIAVFPSFVIWSSQLLKDGLLIFLLVSVMLILLQLQKKLSIQAVIILLLALFSIYSLRFYLFYMVVVAVVGSFFVGAGTSIKTVVRNLIIVLVFGLILTYIGVIRGASDNMETYGNLERIQISRQNLSESANSGFGEEVDVSTPAGAIAAVPIGFTYLYFAPFPWQLNKLNQMLIVPETILWWCLIPVLIIGLKYTFKNKFRVALPIILFSFMLTALYTVFQGNVGMLYRQRTQIQVFLFMFIAVGWTVILERKENKNVEKQLHDQKLEKRLREKNEDT